MSTSAVAENFQAAQLFFKRGDVEATFDDLGVPGIGPAAQKNLADGNEHFDGGITNAAQIVGYFLRLNGDKVKMRELLVDKCGCHGPSVDRVPSGTLAALEAKCEGFIAAEADESAPPALAAAGTTKVMAAFQSKQMSWQDTFDSNPVPGLGDVGRAKLQEIDCVENAAQLMGLFMTYNGDEDEFTEHLLECRIRRQDIEKDNGILQAITEKLATFCLPSVESDGEDGPLSSDDEAEVAERERMLAAGASAAEEARESDHQWRAQGGSVGSSLRAGHASAGSSAGGTRPVEPEPELAAGSGWANTVARKRSVAAATQARATEESGGGGGWAATKARQQAKAAAKSTTPPVTVTPGISSKGLESDSIGLCRLLVYLAMLGAVLWIANHIGLIES